MKISLNKFFYFLLPFTIAVLLQFLPLTNTTGFEFSFLMSLTLFIAGGLLNFEMDRIKKSTEIQLTILFILFIPLFVSLFSNLLISPCPISSDAFFYSIISIPAFFFGYIIGKILKTTLPRFQRLFFLIIFIVLLFISLIEFYFLPQIYFFNPIFGYFPGTIYDENIQITFSLILYRILNIFFFAVVYFYFSKYPHKKVQHAIRIFFAIIIWFGILKGTFGFVTTDSRIENELSYHLESPHFKIYADNEIKYNEKSLIDLHEFYYKEVATALRIQNDIKIKSYIFKNRSQKKKLFGSENADVAKPWLRQIYLDENSFEGTLKHELVHILAGQFGSGPFKVSGNLNPALIEGIAMAVENDYDGNDIDYPVKLALYSGYKISIADLFEGLNFFTYSSSTSYLFAGSFIKYLLQHYEVEKVKELYNTGSFSDSFSKDINSFEEKYYSYLENLPYKLNKATANLYFGRKPLLKKICPRFAARKLQKADEKFFEKEYDDALKLYQSVFSYSHSYSSLSGMISANVKLGNYENALSLIRQNLSSFRNTSYFYNLELRGIDAAALNLETYFAKNYLDSLRQQNPSPAYFSETEFRNELLFQGKEIYEKYILGSSETRYKMLNSLWKREHNSVFLIKLLSYGLFLNKTVEIIHELKSVAASKIDFNTYEYSILSEFAFRFRELSLSEYFINNAIKQNTEPQRSTNLKEQFALINWSQKN